MSKGPPPLARFRSCVGVGGVSEGHRINRKRGGELRWAEGNLNGVLSGEASRSACLGYLWGDSYGNDSRVISGERLADFGSFSL